MRYKKDHPTKQIIAVDLLFSPLLRKFPISVPVVEHRKVWIGWMSQHKSSCELLKEDYEFQENVKLAFLWMQHE